MCKDGTTVRGKPTGAKLHSCSLLSPAATAFATAARIATLWCPIRPRIWNKLVPVNCGRNSVTRKALPSSALAKWHLIYENLIAGLHAIRTTTGETGTDGTFSGFSFGLSIASRQGWRFTGRAKIAENVPSVPEIPVPEIPRISSAFVVQALFAKQLPCGLLAGGNLRIARVKITPYDQHRSAPFLRASVVSATKLTRS